MTYKEQLLDPRWQRRRLEVFQRDNFTCQANKCGATTETLEVHHMEYINIPIWDYPDDMLVTLCYKCHDKELGREPLEKKLSTAFKMQGFLVSDLVALTCKIETDPRFTKFLLTLLRNIQNG